MTERGDIIINRILACAGIAFAVYMTGIWISQVTSLLEAVFEQDLSLITTIVAIVCLLSELSMVAMLIMEATRLFQGNRKAAARYGIMAVSSSIVSLLAVIMLYGVGAYAFMVVIASLVLIVVSTMLDKDVISEVRNERRIKRLERSRRREERARFSEEHIPDGRFCNLNVFYLFWAFVFCSVLGLLFETIYHAVFFGGYQDRAGLLFGPFSPIYGFGGVLMTVALNRLKDANILLIFVISAAIGGTFEYLTSWFLETAFGVVAWDYTDTFLSIDGRTNGYFMFLWGALGVLWVKLLFPIMLFFIRKIPFKLRFSVTTVCIALMLVDGVMTLQALDCWYKREAGYEPASSKERFYAEYFDNEYMENRFQTMTMNPESASRSDLQ